MITGKESRAYMNALLRPYRGRVIFLNVLSVLQSGLQVGFAVVTKHVVDSALQKSEALLWWGIGLGVLLLLLALVHMVYAWLTGSTMDRCVARFRKELLAAATRCSEEKIHAYHSGALLSRGMEDVRAVCDGVINALPTMIGQIARLICAFAAVLLIYPSLTPVLLVGGAAMLAATACLRPILKRHHARVRKAEEQVMSGMQEDLQQLELIRGLQVEKQILQRFDKYLHNSLHAKDGRRRWTVSASSAISFVAQLATGVLLLWGASQVAHSQISYGALAAMLQLLSLFRTPILGLSGLWTRLTGVEVAAERLNELLDLQESSETQETAIGHVQAIVFEHVTFCYPDDSVPVMEDFSLQFPLEKWACLTGLSGKGKSTMFKLMLGLYTPQKGRVYLKTEDAEIPCSTETRHLFAYVPQDYALFSGTVLENLLLVAPDADETIRHSALKAAMADFILEMPNGEQTHIRENNAGLSMGQMQRLAIARAVLMERPILLLDECTSALDAQTEQQVLENLAALGKQAILVTHRPEALKNREHIHFINMDV